ncbi:MAG: type II secretion system major pseudopilin GspG [Sulfurovaceae bacterium]
MKKTSRKAFSLLELLVVILILGILAAFVAPNLIGKGEQAKRDMVCVQMESIANTLKMFKLDNGMYPSTDEGLQILLSNTDPQKYPTYPSKPYMEKMPKDSWQHPFVYLSEGDSFELISLGGDRKEGGDGDGTDIFYSACNK